MSKNGAEYKSKITVVDEVVQSSVRILFSLGMTSKEVASHLRRGASFVEGCVDGYKPNPSAFSSAIPDEPEDECEEDDDGGDDDWHEIGDRHDEWEVLHNLQHKYSNIPAQKSLTRISKKLSIIDMEGIKGCQKDVDLAVECISLKAEAAKWLREEAARTGLSFAMSRKDWISSATDDELEREDHFRSKLVIFDHFNHDSHYIDRFIIAVASALSLRGAEEELDQIIAFLTASGAVGEVGLSKINANKSMLMSRKNFVEFINKFRGEEGVMQSDVIREFQRIDLDVKISDAVIGGWLRQMDAEGQIVQKKVLGRWRISVK